MSPTSKKHKNYTRVGPIEFVVEPWNWWENEKSFDEIFKAHYLSIEPSGPATLDSNFAKVIFENEYEPSAWLYEGFRRELAAECKVFDLPAYPHLPFKIADRLRTKWPNSWKTIWCSVSNDHHLTDKQRKQRKKEGRWTRPWPLRAFNLNQHDKVLLESVRDFLQSERQRQAIPNPHENKGISRRKQGMKLAERWVDWKNYDRQHWQGKVLDSGPRGAVSAARRKVRDSGIFDVFTPRLIETMRQIQAGRV